jgi:5,6-dimethylbenzimidazole synthase
LKVAAGMKKTILITGGCRSGKSRHALHLAEIFSGKKFFLATAQPLDDEMATRISRHREERSAEWTTIEEPLDLTAVFEKLESDPQSVLVLDCLTLWVSNLLMAENSKEKIMRVVDELLDCCSRFPGTLIAITNEVGAGIVPETPLGREFRDLAGEINQRFAKCFDEVVLTVSGIPVQIKSRSESESDVIEDVGQEFSSSKKEGLYSAIYERRDVRQFKPDHIQSQKLKKILDAAHHAGSVGFMQPWNFIVIDDPDIKKRIAENFSEANEEASRHYSGERKDLYSSLKLQGILDAPINICITCDRERSGPHILGRNTVPDTDLFSTCCAVQNLWLAARAEGLGVGWVSILSMKKLKAVLGIPDKIVPVAYLCVGYTDQFLKQPLLEKVGWAKRVPLENLIYHNQWNENPKEPLQ